MLTVLFVIKVHKQGAQEKQVSPQTYVICHCTAIRREGGKLNFYSDDKLKNFS